MIHDPLCPSLLPYNTIEGYSCQCRLIANVRMQYVNKDCVWAEGHCVPECPSCKRLDDLITEREAGYMEGVADCIEVVESIPVPYRVRGQYETWDSYHEGKSDMHDIALTALIFLQEKS